MIIGNLVGGLGNQMFQYACARSLSLDLNSPLQFSIDTFDSYASHNGLELASVFNLRLDIASSKELGQLIGWGRTLPLVRRVLTKSPFTGLAGRRFLAEPHFKFWPALRDRAQQGGYLQGYWQSEHYFADHAALIRSDFAFRDGMSDANQRIAQAICQGPAISVHVRRGDYVNNAKTLAVHGTCSVEYYHAAIDTMLQRCPDARLFAFSDDPQWVSQALRPRHPGLVLVDHNKGLDSYNDMRLMSMCQHHIIANSSFSWWGAWLNPRPEKMVIAPARWFANGTDTKDLIPASWERM